MNEELLQEETKNTEAAAEDAVEAANPPADEPQTMADLEAHFDDANPWNVVSSYMEKGTVLPVKVEGIVNG